MKQKIVKTTITIIAPYTDISSGYAARNAIARIADKPGLAQLANDPDVTLEVEIGDIVETSRVKP